VHLHAERRRSQMTHVNVRADRRLAGRQVANQGSDGGLLHQAHQRRGGEDLYQSAAPLGGAIGGDDSVFELSLQSGNKFFHIKHLNLNFKFTFYGTTQPILAKAAIPIKTWSQTALFI
jgi:hypothetical protein